MEPCLPMTRKGKYFGWFSSSHGYLRTDVSAQFKVWHGVGCVRQVMVMFFDKVMIIMMIMMVMSFESEF